MPASELRGDQNERLLNGLDSFELCLVDGHIEGLFERHDQLDEVEAVSVEVITKSCRWGDLLGVDLQYFNGALLELVERGLVVHHNPPVRLHANLLRWAGARFAACRKQLSQQVGRRAN